MTRENLEEMWRNGYMWSRRQAVTANDVCGETDLTEGEGGKGECLISFARVQ